MRSSIKNRFCDKKGEFCGTLWFITWQTRSQQANVRDAGAFLPGRKKKNSEKKRERGKEKGRAIRAAITFALLSRRKSRDGVADRTRIFHVCLDRRASETRRDTATRRECGERRDSHRAGASANARGRAFVRDDSQMLDRSSRYNPTSGQTGWF